ncbi:MULTISPECIES: acyl-CoA carboxylase subunit epsilon [unclassified Streptomyces]|uniref:acyl-CoA carboxylase subunit epsilon n=1 Tax=Streptomyces TaxID=1883 RepID=UPI0001C1AC76|nr:MULTISPECIES: acyl-CoA carboxylase subunit epsilon [unclassified Streptomyces]MYR66849.1 acyl-CoA carboxylase subunit epsilon [Streptomyces sp. SID4939]MYS03645.1 acyl-CoA carboxylase subunit epsilon [Streptomyces sp. SID4940]MYT66063.1 acyl-CoA carboxylase subunit epsilon [Streptomyces sp. SID8357]MYT88861.1 acyl-CoA carboxylase subunit epsilon [Streptomyces sp. SID8360]MYU37525.1 acyl-CoA carboxylase subunit epsilon [Streptomyces sp. SID8358]MYW41572.1 acyl-CoA carboxylase subunit epsilo
MSADQGPADAPAGPGEDGARPVIRVVRGRADAGEIAALTAVLLARAAIWARTDGEPAPATAGWSRPERIPHHRDPRGRWAPDGRR